MDSDAARRTDSRNRRGRRHEQVLDLRGQRPVSRLIFVKTASERVPPRYPRFAPREGGLAVSKLGHDLRDIYETVSREQHLELKGA